MDQAQLYKGSEGSEAGYRIGEYELKGRDDFVIGCVRAHAADRANTLCVAELSVGDGCLSRRLLGVPDLGDITFADISANRLEAVRVMAERLAPARQSQIQLVECNFDTQFELIAGDSFDVVVALDILEHVFDVFNFVHHCRRVLKPGGMLILRVPNIAYVRHRLRLLAGGLPVTASWFGASNDLKAWRTQWGWDGGHLHLFTVPILLTLLRDSCFSVCLCRDPGTRWAALRDVWPNLLYANPVVVAHKTP